MPEAAKREDTVHRQRNRRARLLLVHGVLHLLGHDHEDPEEAALMQRAEEEILASIPNDGTLTDLVLANHREEGS